MASPWQLNWFDHEDEPSFSNQPITALTLSTCPNSLSMKSLSLARDVAPFAPAIRLLEQGLVQVDSLIHARYPLDEGLSAFEHATKKGTLKVILTALIKLDDVR